MLRVQAQFLSTCNKSNLNYQCGVPMKIYPQRYRECFHLSCFCLISKHDIITSHIKNVSMHVNKLKLLTNMMLMLSNRGMDAFIYFLRLLLANIAVFCCCERLLLKKSLTHFYFSTEKFLVRYGYK